MKTCYISSFIKEKAHKIKFINERIVFLFIIIHNLRNRLSKIRKYKKLMFDPYLIITKITIIC